MKKLKKISAVVLSLVMIMTFSVTLTGCGGSDDPQVTVKNGTFVGTTEDNGVVSFKGIPYAQPATGENRWKPAQPVEESDETYSADEFGWTSLQTEWHSEPASTVNAKENESGDMQSSGEDCLTLNVWAADLEGENRPVMVYFHGGGFGWGGTSDPLYSGKYLVEEHPDVIYVSCNYRVGTMGCLDLTEVPGYTDEYKEAVNLEILDVMESLRYIKENIAAFGGDPENVTIFGESAGGALVTMALVADTDGNGIPNNDEENLFQRCIAQSGSVNLTYTYDDFDNNGTTWALCQAVANYYDDDDLESAEDVTMEDLLAIPEADMYEISTDWQLVPELEECAVSDIYNMPLRGDYKDGSAGVIPEDPYKAIEEGAGKDVDLITGSNQDEWRYWTAEVYEEPILELDEENLLLNLADYGSIIVEPKIGEAKAAAKENGGDPEAVDKLIEMQTERLEFDSVPETLTGRYDNEVNMKEVFAATELGNETGFREPAIEVAEAHAKAGGNTYMYYFAKESDNFEWIGACHASELEYCLHNIDETIFSGTVDEGLADAMCEAWTNFAKTGDPSIESAEWTQYDAKDRNTMTIDMDDDNAMKMVSDPLSAERKLMQPFAKYYLK